MTSTREIMWAEQSVDLYAGDTCNERRDRWVAGAEGDKGDSNTLDVLHFDARHFPPGTKVTVAVPVCPSCGEPRDTGPNPATNMIEHDMICRDCGYDWSAWDEEQFA